MKKGRLEAFSDLLPVIPVLVSYILSFVYIGIYSPSPWPS
jgi:uncharacterized membrane protein